MNNYFNATSHREKNKVPISVISFDDQVQFNSVKRPNTTIETFRNKDFRNQNISKNTPPNNNIIEKE